MAKTILFACVIALAGCAGQIQSQQMERFQDAAHGYKIAIRWGNYMAASKFLGEAATAKQPPDLEKLKRVKVTSYEHLESKIIVPKKMVEQTVEIKYYHVSNMIEKSLLDIQIWEYSDTKDWHLLSGLPDFK